MPTWWVLGGELGVWANDFWHRLPWLSPGLFWNFHVEFVMCQYDLNTEKILFFFFPQGSKGGVRSTVEYLTSASQIMSAGSALMDFDKVAKGEHL